MRVVRAIIVGIGTGVMQLTCQHESPRGSPELKISCSWENLQISFMYTISCCAQPTIIRQGVNVH